MTSRVSQSSKMERIWALKGFLEVSFRDQNAQQCYIQET